MIDLDPNPGTVAIPDDDAHAAALLHPDNRRRHKRRKVDWPARISLDQVAYRDIRIEDVSDGGFGVGGVGVSLAVGQPVWIWLDGIGGYACEVRWQSGGRVGVRLLHDRACLSDDEVAALSAALAAPPARG